MKKNLCTQDPTWPSQPCLLTSVNGWCELGCLQKRVLVEKPISGIMCEDPNGPRPFLRELCRHPCVKHGV